MLLAGLPPDSRTAAAIAEADEPPWTRSEHLLADLVDEVALLLWQNTKPGTKRPKPVPRPGVSDRSNEVRWGAPAPLSLVKAQLAASAPGAGEPEGGE